MFVSILITSLLILMIAILRLQLYLRSPGGQRWLLGVRSSGWYWFVREIMRLIRF